ncbi:hypothetical protein DOTSEDRAFT_21923 [Dothistroma septosporum NZE10]|uniref:Uncharacterized protein n=1 Tax=Dothistroma septosporum (strain NZE10 / CBS 128990) TaxID=675120 RepID=N1PZ04_DOTSN|nr:hypothetical protein DOTSEDRAFT_21923 [Dothistroma septosporum NZE10]
MSAAVTFPGCSPTMNMNKGKGTPWQCGAVLNIFLTVLHDFALIQADKDAKERGEICRHFPAQEGKRHSRNLTAVCAASKKKEDLPTFPDEQIEDLRNSNTRQSTRSTRQTIGHKRNAEEMLGISLDHIAPWIIERNIASPTSPHALSAERSERYAPHEPDPPSHAPPAYMGTERGTLVESTPFEANIPDTATPEPSVNAASVKPTRDGILATIGDVFEKLDRETKRREAAEKQSEIYRQQNEIFRDQHENDMETIRSLRNGCTVAKFELRIEALEREKKNLELLL